MQNNNQNPEDIAMRIMDIGNKCVAYGVKKVFISAILQRSNESLNKIIDNINFILQDLCANNDFIFLNHLNISMDHLYDDVNLNNDGMCLLANNFIYNLNEYLCWRSVTPQDTCQTVSKLKPDKMLTQGLNIESDTDKVYCFVKSPEKKDVFNVLRGIRLKTLKKITLCFF